MRACRDRGRRPFPHGRTNKGRKHSTLILHSGCKHLAKIHVELGLRDDLLLAPPVVLRRVLTVVKRSWSAKSATGSLVPLLVRPAISAPRLLSALWPFLPSFVRSLLPSLNRRREERLRGLLLRAYIIRVGLARKYNSVLATSHYVQATLEPKNHMSLS